MKRILLLFLLPLAVMQTGCKEENSLEDYLTANPWKLINHCHEFGSLTFRSDNTGSLLVNEECVVGSDCIYLLPFDWSVDSETGLLTISHQNQSSAQLICSAGISSNGGIQPSTEIIAISTSTSIISVQSWAFQKD